ncbi:DUF3231 family protein [Lederbergia sp. NSJ-179]|uniref:DUF3231 family protein n=1 Tax=Lederbergia sp. NSJ-179 TaxID=2931402 RepID=UPI001FD012E9|nr:DUF3231 family protein [Lederbergia sp. NSJ-179]MCJ7839518.1 DUF3231 family protein [Lederbergia sp. NSJ-179]
MTKNLHEKLTSADIGKLWVAYMGNSLGERVLSYYLQHIDDKDIKKVLEFALNTSQSLLEKIKEIFIQENIPLPVGLTEEDVNFDAPRLFSDEFYLHYLRYTGKAGFSIYSIALPLMLREDVRDFFIYALHQNIQLITKVNELMKAKSFSTKPPLIPIPEKVDFIKKQHYLNGFFGHIRPPHALEITHLYDTIDSNITSRALLIAFSQVAESDQIRKFFIRGKEITAKHLEDCSQQLNKENLPSPSLLDHLVTTSTISPFSDKLMLYHKIDMFSVKIRSYGNAISLNGRRDLMTMYTKILKDIFLYVEDGGNIMIDQGWMEQPPKAADRDSLASK